MNDTSPGMEARYHAMLLARSPEERLRMAGSMYSAARRLVVASILAADPSASPAALRRALFLRFYGHEFETAERERIAAWLDRHEATNHGDSGELPRNERRVVLTNTMAHEEASRPGSGSSAEPVCPLSDRLRAELSSYLEALGHRFGSDLVSLVAFGSRVRGEGKPESDLDALVIVHGLPRRRWDRYEGLRNVAREVSEEFASMVTPILLTPEEASQIKPYFLGMLSGHAIVRDEGGFFAAVLARLRRRLAELGSRRYVDDRGYEYWDLKPDWKPGDIVTL